MAGGTKGFLFDRWPFEPERFERASSFTDWSEDFIGCVEQSNATFRVEQSNAHICSLLRLARESKGIISEIGGDEQAIERSEVLNRALKKLAVQSETKAIVTHVEGRNPYEAWRQLYRRLEPRNDSKA